MIINKITKEYMTSSNFPNNNWLGEEWYVVEDGTELAQKVQKLFPRLDLVLDENDNIIDVVEVAKTEEELKQEQVQQIDEELIYIDNQGVTRHLENIIEATNSYDTLYETTKALIDRKKELRLQRQTLL